MLDVDEDRRPGSKSCSERSSKYPDSKGFQGIVFSKSASGNEMEPLSAPGEGSGRCCRLGLESGGSGTFQG